MVKDVWIASKKSIIIHYQECIDKGGKIMKLDKVHEDKRGKIYTLTGNDLKESEEITIFTCKKGFARGGCIHKFSDEYVCILEGCVKYFIGDEGPEIMIKGESFLIPKNTPHFFVAQVDSLVAEWGATKKEKEEKHLETRKKVDEINKKMWKND